MDKHEYHLYSVEEMQEWPEPEWLIKGIIPKEGFAQIYGRENCGKTFVVLDWALSIATGSNWANDLEVLQGPVIYVFGEGRTGLKARVNAWLEHHEVERTEAAVPFYAVDQPPQLTKKDDVIKFVEDIIDQLEKKPRLLIFDTLARAIIGVDEDKAKEMGIVVAAADHFRRAFGCATLAVHHSGYDDKHGRGSSAVPGGLDATIHATKKPNELSINLECEKQKESEYFKPIKIDLIGSKKLTDEGKPLTLVSTYGGEGKATPKKGSTKNSAKLLEYMIANQTLPVSYSDLRDTKVIPAGSFSRALTDLVEEGLVSKMDKLYVLTDKALSDV